MTDIKGEINSIKAQINSIEKDQIGKDDKFRDLLNATCRIEHRQLIGQAQLNNEVLSQLNRIESKLDGRPLIRLVKTMES